VRRELLSGRTVLEYREFFLFFQEELTHCGFFCFLILFCPSPLFSQHRVFSLPPFLWERLEIQFSEGPRPLFHTLLNKKLLSSFLCQTVFFAHRCSVFPPYPLSFLSSPQFGVKIKSFPSSFSPFTLGGDVMHQPPKLPKSISDFYPLTRSPLPRPLLDSACIFFRIYSSAFFRPDLRHFVDCRACFVGTGFWFPVIRVRCSTFPYSGWIAIELYWRSHLATILRPHTKSHMSFLFHFIGLSVPPFLQDESFLICRRPLLFFLVPLLPPKILK